MAVYDYLKTTDFITLRNLMLSAVPSDLDISEGSFLYNACSPIALFVSSMFDMMKIILDECSLGTASGENLDNIGTTKPRVYRREATTEKVTIKIIPKDGQPIPTIPETTSFTTEDGTEYKMRKDVTNPVMANLIFVESVEVGPQGSTIGATIEASPAIDGVKSLEIALISATGQERETDDEYRFRIWRTYSQPFTGTVSDYLRKIFSDFPQSRNGFSVENAIVMPRGSKSGAITIVASRKPSPTHLSEGERKELENYFDEKVDGIGGWGASIAPIGHVVQVRDFHDYGMYWKFEIVYRKGQAFTISQQLKDQILESSSNYINSIINESWSSVTKYNEKISRNAVYVVRYYANMHEYSIMSDIQKNKDNKDFTDVVNVRLYQKRRDGSWVPQGERTIRSSQGAAFLPVVKRDKCIFEAMEEV